MVKNTHAIIGLSIIAMLLLICMMAPLIAPHSPTDQDLSNRLLGPGARYPMGTDNLGRCILSRIIFGSRVSVSIALLVVTINAVSGIIVGLISGYSGGIIDNIIMRITDVFLALPGIIIALIIAGILGPSLLNIMLALTVVGWTGYARVVRSSVLSLREKEFVKAEIALGASPVRIVLFHILPNSLTPVLVMMTLGMGYVILSASALSFIGLGAQPPMAEWGAMLNSGRPFMKTAPHLMIFPGLAIMISVMGFNFLGNGLRDLMFKN
jgi:peptide/nickel transport system permease protein